MLPDWAKWQRDAAVAAQGAAFGAQVTFTRNGEGLVQKGRRQLTYNRGSPPNQGTLYLTRGDTNVEQMERRVRTHPLVAVGTLAVLAPAECHGDLYNLKFWTKLGFRMTVGHTRHMDEGRLTHAWVAFGTYCIDIAGGHRPGAAATTANGCTLSHSRPPKGGDWGLGRDIA